MMGKKTARIINRAVLSWGRGYLEEVDRSLRNAPELQEKVFQKLLSGGRQTLFGKERNFDSIKKI